MSVIRNDWVSSYGIRIATIISQLEETRMRGNYGNSLNIPEIITLFNGCKTEIMRQQTEIAALSEALKISNLPKIPKTD